jgi:hypothetical protein
VTSATAPLWPEGTGLPTRLWRRFTAWRRTRPFWGGLLAAFAGVPILYFPYAHLKLGSLTMAMATTAGAGSLVIGVLLMVLGVSVWFQPASRVFCGVAVTILTLVSIPVSNLGGFLMGLIPGLIAGGLLCAWAPLPEEQAAAVEASIAAGPPAMDHWAANSVATTEAAPEAAATAASTEAAASTEGTAAAETAELPGASETTEQAGEAK